MNWIWYIVGMYKFPIWMKWCPSPNSSIGTSDTFCWLHLLVRLIYFQSYHNCISRLRGDVTENWGTLWYLNHSISMKYYILYIYIINWTVMDNHVHSWKVMNIILVKTSDKENSNQNRWVQIPDSQYLFNSCYILQEKIKQPMATFHSCDLCPRQCPLLRSIDPFWADACSKPASKRQKLVRPNAPATCSANLFGSEVGCASSTVTWLMTPGKFVMTNWKECRFIDWFVGEFKDWCL